VGLKRKGSEKRVEQRAMEDVDEGLIAPLELSNGVMEQVEAMAKELRRGFGTGRRNWKIDKGNRGVG
jgi:hypothetical protein